MKLEGVAAFLTGGASGLGAATARVLAEAGAIVALLDRDMVLAEPLARELGGIAVKCDVADHDSLKAAVQQACAAIGPPRIAVNFAGIDVSRKIASRSQGPHPIESMQREININVIGTLDGCALFAEQMMNLDPFEDGERGVLINIASGAAFNGPPGQAAYAASKRAVAGATLPLARDLAPYGIRVMTIAPGFFKTPLASSVDDKHIDKLIAMVPFPKRWGDPREIGELVKHICQNRMLNGETIQIDGAMR
ncbi:MAG: SDR family NAD(P)-dependent oxidoreductase [Gammaproteobacteria bacterium]|nr:SDR family NAD(P)-dependent oxidoreductase [Gammaproteobacteria bacterium]MBK8133814.1 SDR family NAD(P)-dependent oxidoreductase [Gammaproteobacteria bacterium]